MKGKSHSTLFQYEAVYKKPFDQGQGARADP